MSMSENWSLNFKKKLRPLLRCVRKKPFFLNVDKEFK